jgi:hypothetical protein
MHKVKHNTIDYNIHYISGADSYMFRQQGTIIREFINNKVL